MKKAVIVGASAGIGRALALEMSRAGYALGLTARRHEELEKLQSQLAGESWIRRMDVQDSEDSVEVFRELSEAMGGTDLVIINAGVGHVNPELPLEDDLHTVAVNVAGFTTLANCAYRYFREQGAGHIVGLSSIAALRGGPAPAYNASKAYVSSYLEGLGCKARRDLPALKLTDVRPGFVATDMTRGAKVFWCAPADKAAQQILRAIESGRRVVYITRRWRLIAWLLKSLPYPLYRRLIA